MRPVLFAWLVLIAAPVAGLAQSGPFLAVVTDPEVKLRATPSDRYPETGTLTKGAAVLVVEERDNGWLAVQSPPGTMYSVSWVPITFVDFDTTRPTPQNVTVQEQEVTLRAGQMGLAQPLNIATTKVPPGTILTVIGGKVQFEGRWWYPVAPPAGDFRYLPKQAVRFEKTVNTSFAVRDITPAGSATPPASPPGPAAVPAGGAGPATMAGKPAVQHPLWGQAEAAEREGKYDEAERLFFQLARVMNEPGGDHDIANLCYTRIHTLREKRRGGGGTAGTLPPSGGSAKPPATPPAADPRDDRARWTGPGKLVRSALALDGRKTYALESNPGVTVCYVVGAPGVDLERYVGLKVDVYGSSYTRRELSKPYVVATRVADGQ